MKIFILLLITAGFLVLSKKTHAQSFQWVRSSSSNGYDSQISGVSYGAGKLTATGLFAGSISFSNQTLTSTGGIVPNALTGQWSPAGVLGWFQKGGGTSSSPRVDNVLGKAVASDALGNSYVVFQVSSNVLIGQTLVKILPIGPALVLAKFNKLGDVVWLKTLSATISLEPGGLAVDAAGTCFLAASFAGQATVDISILNSGQTSAQSRDGLLLKVDASGNTLWTKQVPGSYGNVFSALSPDGAGNVYAAGHFDTSIAFSPSVRLNAATGGHLFIAKFDAAGDVVWARNMGTQDLDFIKGLTVDATGSVAACGSFGQKITAAGTSTASFGQLTLTTAGTDGSEDGFVVKLDAEGTFIWAQAISGPAIESADAIVAGPLNCFYVSGLGNVDTSIGSLSATMGNGSEDGFVAKFTGIGSPQWLTSYGGPDSDYFAGVSLAADKSGHIYVGGSFRGSAYFGTSSAVGFPNRDAAFIAQITDNIALSTTGPQAVGMALQLYPNPAHGQVRVAWAVTVHPASLEIIDPLGRVVRKLLVNGGLTNTAVSLEGLQNGIYIIRANSEAFSKPMTQRLTIE